MLFYVVRAGIAWRSDPAAVRRLIRAYARTAAWLFALAVGTGLVSALLLVTPLGDLLSTWYGRVLVIKVALVAAAAGLALTGRAWLRREPAPGAGPARATRAEAGVLAGVLAAAGLLVALPAPATGNTPLPFPPPASGPQVALSGRAGEISVYATASAGQLVLQLSAPQYGNEAQEDDTAQNGAAYSGSVTLAAPGAQPQGLPLRGCGAGCYVAPARWANGDDLLTLQLSAAGVPGGTVALDVPWPPRPGAALLRRVVAALQATPRMTLYERVTSDTALGLGKLHSTPVSGSDFLAGEPYKAGIAPVAAAAPAAGGLTRLLLGFPGSGVQVSLTVTPAGRLVSETLTDPDHLTTRSFAYPETGGHGSP
jgi:copper transport protein